MSDLDLDKIRRRLESVRFAVGIGATLSRIVHEDVPALLAEVERLKANQQPDDGEWRTEYATESGDYWHDEFSPWCELQRRVWYGPAEPLSDVLATPDPDSATQTTP